MTVSPSDPPTPPPVSPSQPPSAQQPQPPPAPSPNPDPFAGGTSRTSLPPGPGSQGGRWRGLSEIQEPDTPEGSPNPSRESGFPPPPVAPGPRSGPAGPGGAGGRSASRLGRGTWISEELAELNRRALTPQGSAAKRRKEPDPEAQPAPLSRRGTLPRGGGIAAARKRYLVHGRTQDEESPLEKPIPWGAFWALAASGVVALFTGKLAPVGIAIALLGCVGAGFGLYECRRFRRWRGAVPSVAGIVLCLAFGWIHYSAYAGGRDSLPSLQYLGNRGTGNSTDYELLRVAEDFGMLDQVVRVYREGHSTLPPSGKGGMAANGAVAAKDPAFQIPTFRIHAMAYDRFDALTTPVGYLSRYPLDPFATDFAATYVYYATPDNEYALLLSPGPDRRYQIDPEKDFIPGDPASRDRMLTMRWDPTNGTRSGGDLWYVVAFPAKPAVDPATGLPMATGLPFATRP